MAVQLSKDAARRVGAAVRKVEMGTPGAAPRAAGPRVRGGGPGAWFYVTVAISSASDSGSTVSNAKLTRGTGKGRACLYDTSGNPYPNVNAQDVTIRLGFELTNTSGTIPVGYFAWCEWAGSAWQALATHKCIPQTS